MDKIFIKRFIIYSIIIFLLLNLYVIVDTYFDTNWCNKDKIFEEGPTCDPPHPPGNYYSTVISKQILSIYFIISSLSIAIILSLIINSIRLLIKK